MLSLISLPVDILIIVLEPLDFDDLNALGLSCRLLYSVVTEYGWTNYLRAHPRPSYSLARARSTHWTPRARVYYDVTTDRAWAAAAAARFIARPLSRPWAGKLQPVLAINNSRLVVGAGCILYSYAFGASPHPGVSPPVRCEGTVSLLSKSQGLAPERPRNITAIAFVADGGLDATLDVAFQDGAIERVQLVNLGDADRDLAHDALTATRSLLPPMPNGDFVESISSESDIVLSLSSTGHARLGSVSALASFASSSTSTSSSTFITSSSSSTNSNSTDSTAPHPSFSAINLNSRSWSSTLCLRASTPYAAFGTASTTPLTVHTIHQDGQLSARPTAILHTAKAASAAASLDISLDTSPITSLGTTLGTSGLNTPATYKLPSSAVYGLAQGPPDAPWGASPSVLVSGWYDGAVRCYDLRAPASASASVPSVPAISSSTASAHAGTRSGNGGGNGSGSGNGNGNSRVPVHAPVLTLRDRWSHEPIYSIACGGGAGAHVAAGTARHSVVSFWDVRYCNANANSNANTNSNTNTNSNSNTNSNTNNQNQNESGWSVYAPGGDASPVYSVAMESSRFFGVTQSRPFVYDFGPGVSLDTYPPLPPGRGIDGLKQKKGAWHRATYHVLRREHNSAALCSEH